MMWSGTGGMSLDRSDDGDVGAVWKSGEGDREDVESIDM
jgi:hypothetical protein